MRLRNLRFFGFPIGFPYFLSILLVIIFFVLYPFYSCEPSEMAVSSSDHAPLAPFIRLAPILLSLAPTSVNIPLPSTSSPSDPIYRQWVMFLEDTFIRELSLDERRELRLGVKPDPAVFSSPEYANKQYNKAYNDYLEAIGCPSSSETDKDKCAYYIFSYALNELYSSKKRQIDNIDAATSSSDSMDVETTTTTSSSSLATAATPHPLLSSFPLGFTTGSAPLDLQVLKLKLLHLNSLSKVQQEVHCFISELQEVTARQRASNMEKDGGKDLFDMKQGKVGR